MKKPKRFNIYDSYFRYDILVALSASIVIESSLNLAVYQAITREALGIGGGLYIVGVIGIVEMAMTLIIGFLGSSFMKWADNRARSILGYLVPGGFFLIINLLACVLFAIGHG